MRYIRTYDNSKKLVIMKIVGCEDCPLMKFNPKTFKSTCRIFGNKISNLLCYVNSYNLDTERVNQFIQTPDWCCLPKNIYELDKDSNIYNICQFSVSITDKNNFKFSELDINNLPIIQGIPILKNPPLYVSDGMLMNEIKKKDVRVIKDLENRIITYTKDSYLLNSCKNIINNSKKTTKIIKKETCSLCGIDDETVNRTKYNGMCSKCLKIYDNDEENKKKAFINNFRLKRKIDIEDKTYKFNSELNI
jgi:hypothetical protein